MVIFSSDLVSIVASASVIAVETVLMMPSINTAVSKRTDEDSQGVVMGLLGSFNSVGRTFGPILGGLIYSMAIILPYAVSASISLLTAATFGLYSMSRKNTIEPLNIHANEMKI